MIRIFLFLPLPPSPPLSSFPPWHLLLFCLLLIRKNIFNGYISQSHMNAPFYVPSKEHSLQSGYDSSLFPSQSFRQQLGSREQEAGESWAAHPDLARHPVGAETLECPAQGSGQYHILDKTHISPKFSLSLSPPMKISCLEQGDMRKYRCLLPPESKVFLQKLP